MLNENMISVIIPVYNLEKYIKRCIDSVCNQTYKNLEIIVVDDGSTDNSAEIIKDCQISDSRIKYIYQKNSGVVEARKNGVKNSTGEYIGFVDGDDTIDEDMYEFLYNNIAQYNADISHCGYKMIVGSRTDYYYGTNKKIVQNNEQGLKDIVEGKLVEPGLCNKLYKSNIIEQSINNSNIIGLKNLEDLMINYYAFKLSQNSIFEDVCKYNYIVRNNSSATSKISTKKIDDQIFVFKTIMKDERVCNAAYSRYIAYLIGCSTSNIDKDNLKAIKKLLKDEYKTVKHSDFLSKKLKAMYFGSAFLHPLYLIVRRIYEKKTSVNNKYNV